MNFNVEVGGYLIELKNNLIYVFVFLCEFKNGFFDKYCFKYSNQLVQQCNQVVNVLKEVRLWQYLCQVFVKVMNYYYFRVLWV